jgi:hypothetical protein|tara:strand:- start:318 stop:878 length:561 start_codon:yes stop_codon:yes gene_type:complete
MITNDQWELIDEKYGKLLTTICTRISGDMAIATFDDNLQDLRIAALDAVQGFAKKEGKSFSEFWGTSGFNKYMKTCLWNLKNKKGARISKRYNINKNTVDITEFSEILVSNDHDSSGVSTESVFDQVRASFSEDQRDAINIMSKHPEYIKPNGKVNVSKLSTELGYCVAKTRKIMDEIRNKLKMSI